MAEFGYTYDGVGNRLSVSSLDGITRYTYDDLNRLTRVVLPSGDVTEYVLDSEGNRTSVRRNQANDNYEANALNEYTQVGDARYQYNANGAMISRQDPSGTTTFDYDYDGRLIRVAGPRGTASFQYDALGTC